MDALVIYLIFKGKDCPREKDGAFKRVRSNYSMFDYENELLNPIL